MVARICLNHGCPKVATAGRHCAEHTTRNAEQNAFYKSYQWKKTRKSILARDPICRECGHAPSKQVDHIDGNWRNDSSDNLQGICVPCHAQKHSNNWLKRGGTEMQAWGDRIKTRNGRSSAAPDFRHFSGYGSPESGSESEPRTVPAEKTEKPFWEISL